MKSLKYSYMYEHSIADELNRIFTRDSLTGSMTYDALAKIFRDETAFLKNFASIHAKAGDKGTLKMRSRFGLVVYEAEDGWGYSIEYPLSDGAVNNWKVSADGLSVEAVVTSRIMTPGELRKYLNEKGLDNE